MLTQRPWFGIVFFGIILTSVACSVDLPQRTCDTDSDCGADQYCNSAGLCAPRGTPVSPDALAADPELDATVDIASDEGQDLIDEGIGEPDAADDEADTAVTCEPSLAFCDGRQIMICSTDGASAEPGDLCDDPDERCRAGECVSQPTNYGLACEETDDCEDDLLVCLDEVCVTTPPGESGDPCWNDLECEDTTVCYQLGDVCQEGNAGEPCTEAEHCQFDLVCTSDDVDPGVCTVGVLDSPCTSDDHCQFPLICGPEANRFCQRGNEGDPCDDDANCSDLAPYCGPTNTCQDGEEGDGCSTADDCAVSLLCSSASQCQEGSDGDACASSADCASGTGFCGPSGCQDGGEGDPCSDEVLHCQDALFCSTLGECQDGSDGDLCGNDTDCAGVTPICGPFGCQVGIEGDDCFTSFDCADEAAICSTDNVCQDGDEGDTCGYDGDCVCDCAGGVCEAGEPFAQSREIVLYEPCAEMSPAFRDEACDAGVPAYEDGSSSWQRTNEPLEIPLVNGFIDSSLVAYWPLNGNATEATGTWDGTNNGAYPIEGAFADANGAMDFDGEDYIQVPGSEDLLRGASALTMMAWVYPRTLELDGESSRMVISNNYFTDNNEIAYHIDVIPAGVQCHVHTTNGSSSNEYVPIPIFAWTHVACVFGDGEFRQFINGRLANTTSATGTVDGSDSSQPFTIGARTYTGGVSGRFDGRIDDSILVNRALTPTEIAVYYNSRQPFGTSMVSDAQEDFDDVRVTEQCGCCDEERVTHEIIGVRPHSDTDLDHIVAYWRLDGDGENLVSAGGDLSFDADTWGFGRFGGTAEAAQLDGDDDYLDLPTNIFASADELTIEFWFQPEADLAPGGSRVDLLYQGSSPSCNVGLAINYNDFDGQLFFVFDATHSCANGIGVFSETLTIHGGRWHHLAVTKDASNEMAIYLDGLRLGTTDLSEGSMGPVVPNISPLRMGNRGGDDGGDFAGLFDEVILHNVVRSADYIYNRANPGVPMVRFLASTEETANGDGHYDYNTYRLYWDNPDAEFIPPLVPDPQFGEPCEGLLSPCNGYVGWWRFDEGIGNVVVDSSTNRLHGIPQESPEYRQGPHGLAMEFDNTSQYVIVAHDDRLNLEEFTFEATVFDIRTASDNGIISKGDGSGAADDNFMFRISNSGPLNLSYLGGDPLTSDDDVVSEQWVSLAGTHSTDALSVFIDFVESGQASATATPPHNTLDLYLGAHRDIVGLTDLYNGAIDSVRIMNRALEVDEFLHFPMSGWALGETVGGSTCLRGAAGTPCVEDVDCAESAPICSYPGFCWEDSPEWIVFIRDGEVWRVRPDGGEESQVSAVPDGAEIRSVALAPHASMIAYVEYYGEFAVENRLVTQSIAGGEPVEVVATGGNGYSGVCDFDPSGGRILYVRDVVSGGGQNYEIFEIGVDGSSDDNLSNHSNNESCGNYSPDGLSIVFASGTPGCGPCNDVYLMNRNGSGRTEIFDLAEDQEPGPVFAPNGETIVVSGWQPVEVGDLYLINTEGDLLLQLTETPGIAEEGNWWSPDGTQVIYQREGDLWFVDSDGSEAHRFIEDGSYPVWRGVD